MSGIQNLAISCQSRINKKTDKRQAPLSECVPERGLVIIVLPFVIFYGTLILSRNSLIQMLFLSISICSLFSEFRLTVFLMVKHQAYLNHPSLFMTRKSDILHKQLQYSLRYRLEEHFISCIILHFYI